jgi:hypothetical protein
MLSSEAMIEAVVDGSHWPQLVEFAVVVSLVTIAL